MTAKEKAAAGLWMLKQAIVEAHGIAYALLSQMADDGELEKGDESHPLSFLPRNGDSGK
jgi:hypothetical protein